MSSSVLTLVCRKMLELFFSFYMKLTAMLTPLSKRRQPAQPQTKKKYDSAAKMREKRKDPAYVFKQEYLRTMLRIQKEREYKPTHSTLTKYQITLKEINEIRAKQGWDPIHVFVPKQFTPTPGNVIQAEITAETKLALSKYAEEQRLRIVEKKGAVDAYQEQLKRANRGKIVEIDRANLFSINTIIQYFIRNPGIPAKNSCAASTRTDDTLRTYFGIKIDKDGNRVWRGKGGLFFHIFNNWKDGHCSKDIRPCLGQVDDLLVWLKERQSIWKTASSKLAALTPLLVVLGEYPPIRDKPLAKRAVEKIAHLRQDLKSKTRIEQNTRRRQEVVSPFEDIKLAIYDTFQKKNDEPTPNGKIDKAWLYIQLYDECPVRDDLGSLLMVFEDVPTGITEKVSTNRFHEATKRKLNAINDGNNIIFIPPEMDKPVTLALHRFKTYKTFGIHLKKLSLDLSNEVRLYAAELKGKYLFGKGKMSNYVSTMLTKAGIKDKRADPEYKAKVNVGSINVLRKSYISRALNDPSLSEFDREDLAFAMKHSPDTSPKYLREYGLNRAMEEKKRLENITYD